MLSGKVQARSINGSKLLSLLTLLCLSNSAHTEILKPHLGVGIFPTEEWRVAYLFFGSTNMAGLGRGGGYLLGPAHVRNAMYSWFLCDVIIFPKYKIIKPSEVLVSSDVRPSSNVKFLQRLSPTGFLIMQQSTFEFPSLCVA